jgi:flagellin-like hook-associated protein FlgL
MRITAHHLLERSAGHIGAAQTDIAKLSDQVSSGIKVRHASDDPVAWIQARREQVRAAISQGRGDAIGLGSDQLAETERALGTIGGVLSEARQIAVQAANANYVAGDRAKLELQVAGLFSVALASANSRNAAGEYVLAGAQGLVAPFDAAGVFVGDASRRDLEAGEGASASATLSGSADQRCRGRRRAAGAGRLVTALGANDVPICAAIDELDAAHYRSARPAAGRQQMAVFQDADAFRVELENTLAGRIAALTEVDIIDAATDLAQRTQALEASQAVNGRLATLLSPGRR